MSASHASGFRQVRVGEFYRHCRRCFMASYRLILLRVAGLGLRVEPPTVYCVQFAQ